MLVSCFLIVPFHYTGGTLRKQTGETYFIIACDVFEPRHWAWLLN